MNILYEKLPDFVIVKNKKYKIETNFREWIRFCELVEDESIPVYVKCSMMMEWYYKVPEDIEAAIYALGDFLSAKYMNENYEDKETSVSNKPAFNFDEDAGCIYAAFIECYGIDLQKISYMHWWKFLSLFYGLPEDTEIKQRMMYRTIDPNTIKDKEERKKVKMIQRKVALHNKKKKISDYDIGDIFS